MMNRRNALLAMSATALGGLRARQRLDDGLRKDFARLASREYSEEGVPVFLACDDLVAKQACLKQHPVQLTPFNAALSSEFRQNAEAYLRIKPDAGPLDVGKVIELMTDRDFLNPAADTQPVSTAPTFSQNAENLADLFATRPVIRAVNFHNTSRAQAALYERQIAQYSQHFSPVNQDELETYLVTGEWHKPKPGLIVSVFEGYRNSYDVLLPILEKYGFVGWFWMITGFLNTPVPDQRNYAEHHDIDMLTHEYPDGRYALTWDELRQIDKKHVIASHTRSHTLLSQLDPATQRSEVIGSQQDFVKELGHPVRAFVSLTGPAYGENAAIDRLIDEAGYDIVFSNFLIQRIKAKHVGT